MSDMYLAKNAGDLTVWLAASPDGGGEDVPILNRSDLDIGRPLGMVPGWPLARAVTAAHDELWAKITDGLINHDTCVWASGHEYRRKLYDAGEYDWESLRWELPALGEPWYLLSGFDPADFTDPDLTRDQFGNVECSACKPHDDTDCTCETCQGTGWVQ